MNNEIINRELKVLANAFVIDNKGVNNATFQQIKEWLEINEDGYKMVIPSIFPWGSDRLAGNLQSIINDTLAEDEIVTTLGDESDKWLEKVSPEVFSGNNSMWDTLRNYLSAEEEFSDDVISQLYSKTHTVLKFLGNPESNKSFSKKGLVIGEIQSGKTTNYLSLIAKAIDVGYRNIVVLTGVTEDLRKQTQSRTEEYLGRARREIYYQDSEIVKQTRIITKNPKDGSGDFNSRDAQQWEPLQKNNGSPLIWIMKKNYRSLGAFIKYLERFAKKEFIDNEGSFNSVSDFKFSDHNLIVIDDECDNASVNTGAYQEDPENADNQIREVKRINGQIRTILNKFEKNSYIGYTATPYAQIFISKDIEQEEEDEWGKDIFPEDFMVCLDPPLNHFGPNLLFYDEGEGEDFKQPFADTILDVVSKSEYLDWLPPKHKKNWIIPPNALPLSLKRAIKYFFLSAAVKNLRELNDKNNAMLVHVSLFTDVQRQIRDEIQKELNLLAFNINHGERTIKIQIEAEFKDLYYSWQNTYKIMSEHKRTDFIVGQNFQWPPVFEEIKKLLELGNMNSIVKTINSASDSQRYAPNENLPQIFIGGNVLSRGMTIEGLLVSYYLRHTQQFDTQDQMSRWYGYRNGWVDLVKIFSEGNIIDLMEDSAFTAQECRDEIKNMNEIGAKPDEFRIYVNYHTSGIITARSKLRSLEIKEVDGKPYWSLHINNKPDTVKSVNEKFMNTMDGLNENYPLVDFDKKGVGAFKKFESVEPDAVLEILQSVSDLYCNESSQKLKYAREYIKQNIDNIDNPGALSEWNIFIHDRKSRNYFSDSVPFLKNQRIGLVKRKIKSRESDEINYAKLGVVHGGENHMKLDLDADQEKEFERQAENLKGSTRYDLIRKIRKPQNALMIIYFVNTIPGEKSEKFYDDDIPVDDREEFFPVIVIDFPKDSKAEIAKLSFNRSIDEYEQQELPW